ncbi:hypothetical protein [Alistipes sp.]|uniref:hypothetical protein n=1 Tax=Alistipes sp. TaxID=1872444 RepID=UPI0025C2DFBB|nr:hypothetical protein [Alistipes sp.]
MAKIQNLSDLQPEVAFTEYDFHKNYTKAFARTEPGRIKKLLPLREMAISLGLIPATSIIRSSAESESDLIM